MRISATELAADFILCGLKGKREVAQYFCNRMVVSSFFGGGGGEKRVSILIELKIMFPKQLSLWFVVRRGSNFTRFPKNHHHLIMFFILVPALSEEPLGYSKIH